VKNQSPNIPQISSYATYGSSQGSGVVSGVTALHPQKECSRTQQTAAAGLTVIPNEGLQTVLPAEAGKLEQVCMS